MADARSEDERLPWLDTPRRPAPGAPRRKLPRTPIYVLLSLFLLASVGVMSFLVGRGSVPVAPTATPAPEPSPQRATVALPPAPPPVPPPSLAPAETAIRIAEAPSATPVPKRAAKRSVSRAKKSARAAARARAARSARSARRARASSSRLEAVRAAQTPPAARRAAPLVPAGRVVQIGTYRSRWQADAAHRRLARAYPYIRTIPKMVRPARPFRTTRTFYRLQYQAYSPEYARVLCTNLRSIGRGCVVLPQGM